MSKKVALSFSGGKDSCLALHRLQQQHIEVACLITTIWKQSKQTVAHDEKHETIVNQANSIGIPVHFMETDFYSYTEDFVDKLEELRKEYDLDGVAFGDIYLDGHREWGEEVAEKAGLEPIYPIWTEREHVQELLVELVDVGFKARVIKVDEEELPKEWVGRMVDKSFIYAILQTDACPLGESGEYHTFVYDGPIFQWSVE